MVGNVPGNGYGVDWRSTAYAQDAKSPIVAPLTAVQGVAHDSSGGWMTGGAGGESVSLACLQPDQCPMANCTVLCAVVVYCDACGNWLLVM
jgi:hypothetical protein